MYYIFINNRQVFLDHVPYFSEIDKTDLSNLLVFLMKFSSRGFLQEYLSLIGLIPDEELIRTLEIKKEDKGSFTPVKYSSALINEQSAEYFDYSSLYYNISERILTDKNFTKAFLEELISLNCYSSLAKLYLEEITFGGNSSLDDISNFVNDSFDDMFYQHRNELGLFLNAYNKEKPKTIIINGDTEQEEFLESNDYLYYNPGLSPKAKLESDYQGKILKYKEKSKYNN